jgi:hypothetical protein
MPIRYGGLGIVALAEVNTPAVVAQTYELI